MLQVSAHRASSESLSLGFGKSQDVVNWGTSTCETSSFVLPVTSTKLCQYSGNESHVCTLVEIIRNTLDWQYSISLQSTNFLFLRSSLEGEGSLKGRGGGLTEDLG